MPDPGRLGRVRPRVESGISLVEVILALMLLALGLLGGVSVVLSGTGLATQNSSSADATDTLRHLVEEMQGFPVGEVYARFNDDPGDDPDGAGTAPGNRFTVAPDARGVLLDAAGTAGGAGGRGPRAESFEVEVSFPVDGTGMLSETATSPAWGEAGWDLNGDGTITGGDRSGDYNLLPIRIRLTWETVEGEGTLEVVRLLSSR